MRGVGREGLVQGGLCYLDVEGRGWKVLGGVGVESLDLRGWISEDCRGGVKGGLEGSWKGGRGRKRKIRGGEEESEVGFFFDFLIFLL